MKTLKEILSPVLALFVICAAAAVLLALCHEATKDVISSHEADAAEESRKALFPDAEEFDGQKITLDNIEYDYAAALDGKGELIGFIFVTGAKGYGGEISLMTAIYPDATIAGLRVLSANETPNLGTKATAPEYLAEYIGRKGPLGPSSGGDGYVDAISGASVTSRAVNNAVDLAFKIYFAAAGKG